MLSGCWLIVITLLKQNAAFVIINKKGFGGETHTSIEIKQKCGTQKKWLTGIKIKQTVNATELIK